MENLCVNRFMLKYASGLSLSVEEATAVRRAPTYLADIQANINKGMYNPFEGLTTRQKLELQAYLVFSRENAFTSEAQGHTPAIDSVRTILKEDHPYQDDPRALDYDLAVNLNKLKDMRQSPLSAKIGIDEHGTPYTSKD